MKRLMIAKRVLCLTAILMALPVYSQSENTNISLFSWRPADKRVWNAVNESGLLPGITVNARATVLEYYSDLVLLNIQNKKADVFLWQPGASRLKPLIDRGFIEPYKKDLSMMSKGALLGAKGPNGRYYGVPFAVQLQALMVNGLEAEKIGIYETPQSIPELESAFDKILKAGKTPLSMPLKDDWYISQLIGEVFTAGLVDELTTKNITTGDTCFTSPEYTEIFKVILRWVNRGYISDQALASSYYDTYKAVSFGNAISSLEGAWMTGKQEVYYTMNPNYQFKFWPIAGKSGQYSAFGDGTYQVASNSNNKIAAQKVLEFTTTKAFAEIFVKQAQQLPAYAGDLSIPPGDLKIMAKLLQKNASPVSLFNTYELNKNEPSYKQLFTKAIRQLVNKDITPDNAGRLIQKGLNSWNYIGAENCEIE